MVEKNKEKSCCTVEKCDEEKNCCDEKKGKNECCSDDDKCCTKETEKKHEDRKICEGDDEKRKDYFRKITYVLYCGVAYTFIEAFGGMALGYYSGGISIASFGLDAFIELFSSFLVLWRIFSEYSGTSRLSLQRERIATVTIGSMLVILALGTLFASYRSLISSSVFSEVDDVDESVVSILKIALTATSFILMATLYKVKMHFNSVLHSAAIQSDANCTLSCTGLSFLVLLASFLQYTTPSLLWIDPLFANALGYLILREGHGMVQNALSADFDGASCGC